MNEGEQDIARTEDSDLTTLFRYIGSRPPLPEGMENKWATLFREELDKVIARRKKRRLKIAGLAASTLLAVIFLGSLWQKPPGDMPVIAQLASSSGDILLNGNLVKETKARRAILSNTAIRTQADSLARLSYKSADIRLDVNTSIRLTENRLVLLAGRVFVSTEGNPASPLRIKVRHIEVSDIGTQFLVATQDDVITTQVRDGAVLISLPGREYRAKAEDTARRVDVMKSGRVEMTEIDRHGPSWDWIMQLSPEFRLEGKSAYDLLQWSSHESGRQLLFTDPSLETLARTTILHGDIAINDPEETIDAVLATTRLMADREDANKLEISLRPFP